MGMPLMVMHMERRPSAEDIGRSDLDKYGNKISVIISGFL